uniref:Uncharacterized protein n=1 Tax=Siphoviridae sp. ctbbV81 TaxID=2827900 RepID=A0A8S5TQK7_9CAUD|nr:MAG TPA: hypothetical protein [Siphoviridae sp. ctbbV81]DAG27229.1 MAG TPA: hypothetical protein [Caudoviricetes sp.]DAH50099.1 MAG TPA: hypothetical protein [Caudoviricetes sp.]
MSFEDFIKSRAKSLYESNTRLRIKMVRLGVKRIKNVRVE